MNVLILGSLPKNEEERSVYNIIVEVCKSVASTVHSPLDTVKFQGTEVERYNRAISLVNEADLIIGEQSSPSTGQGIELGIAITLNKDIHVVAKEHSRISSIVKGCPQVKNVVSYTSLDDLKHKLRNILQ